MSDLIPPGTQGRSRTPLRSHPAASTPRGGQPNALTRIIDHDRDGNPITSADRFLQIIGFGEHLDVACDAAAIHRDTVRRHLRDGATLAMWIENGRRHADDLTPNERVLWQFSRDFTLALARGSTEHAAIRNQLMRGGRTVTTRTTTEKVLADGTIERTTVTRDEVLAPSESMLRWHAERRWANVYGARLAVDVNVRAQEVEIPEPDEDDVVALMLDIADEVIDVGEHAPRVEGSPDSGVETGPDGQDAPGDHAP